MNFEGVLRRSLLVDKLKTYISQFRAVTALHADGQNTGAHRSSGWSPESCGVHGHERPPRSTKVEVALVVVVVAEMTYVPVTRPEDAIPTANRTSSSPLPVQVDARHR
jgi:hypothetical protein